MSSMEIAIVAPRSYKSSLTSHRIRRGRKLEQNRLRIEGRMQGGLVLG